MWFVIIVVTCRLEISSRTFSDSGSENGPGAGVGLVSTLVVSAPGPPQKAP